MFQPNVDGCSPVLQLRDTTLLEHISCLKQHCHLCTPTDVGYFHSKHLKELDVWIKFSTGDKENEDRIGCAGGSSVQFCKMLNCWNIHLRTRVNFLNSLIRSSL